MDSTWMGEADGTAVLVTRIDWVRQGDDEGILPSVYLGMLEGIELENRAQLL